MICNGFKNNAPESGMKFLLLISPIHYKKNYMNLPELLQQHFNYPPLQKIDPNTQEVTDNDTTTAGEFGQAAIPAILAGLYEFTRSDEGADTVISGENSPSWVKTIFGYQHQKIIKRVADYANTTYDITISKLNDIAAKSIELIKEAIGPDPKNIAVKELMSNQVNNILPYLPAVLQAGELLNDTTLDDKTNKMEGPLSSLMQAIGSGFSGSDKDEKLVN